jgi:uncharacterized protein (TIGR03435 family)
MYRIITGSILMNCAGFLAFSQTTEAPRFQAADVHVSAKSVNQFLRTSPVRGERYEVKNATMVDLIRLAYGLLPDKVLGGPIWLEMDRFDVIAKQPPGTTPDTQKLMLQSLLAERFKLVVHTDTKPLSVYALTVGKKPQLKEADGSGDSGCMPQSAAGAAADGPRFMLPGPGGTPVTINLGSGGVIEFKCRNVTMAAFAEGLRGMLGANVGPNPVLDQTGLNGKWNFDVRWTLGFMGPMGMAGERISVFDAVEKQLGLKLEDRQIPTPVLMVDSVNQKPSENPPGTAEILPPVAVPTEFEVATIKPTSPDMKMGRFQMQPGGRLVTEGLPLRFLISRAFNTNSNEQITGLPPWVDTQRFDVLAKVPSDGPPSVGIDQEAIAPMMLSLLKDRFKMTYHTEERPVSAYSLVAGKTKMKKADPATRTWCKNPATIPGAPPPPPGTQALICQNITMAQFADRLRGMAQGLEWPVLDQTGLEGGWDFMLSYSPFASMNLAAAARGGDSGQAGNGAVAASDPSVGFTIFEAVERQLGLKLDKQKRTASVIVIDHLEQMPTEN